MGGGGALLAAKGRSVASANERMPAVPSGMKRLVAACVVHRHGDRAPIGRCIGEYRGEDHDAYWAAQLPGDEAVAALEAAHPFVGPQALYGGEVAGQLTRRGVRQLEGLGAELRRRWVDEAGLLPAELEPSLLSVRSTCVRRCHLSAAALLAGLYPGVSRREGAGGCVPVRGRDGTTETMWAPQSVCPGYDRVKERAVAGWLETEGGAGARALARTVGAAFGLDEQSDPEQALMQLGEVLQCAEAHGLDVGQRGLPMAAYWRARDAYYGARFTHGAPGEALVRLASGRLLAEVAGHLRAAAANANAPRVAVFSGHDVTLVPLLVALGVLDDENMRWPAYAAHLVFELFLGEDDELYLRLAYCGQEVQGCRRWQEVEERVLKERALHGLAFARACGRAGAGDALVGND